MPEMTYAALRFANTKRLPRFKNAKGEPAHAQPDGSDWSLDDWLVAVVGELGEAANLMKKVRRGDITLLEARPDLADELADIATYMDILAMRMGVVDTRHFDDAARRARTESINDPARLMRLLTRSIGDIAETIPRRAAPLLPQNTAFHIASLYLEALALSMGITLLDAIADKFNRISKRVGAEVYIDQGCVVVDGLVAWSPHPSNA